MKKNNNINNNDNNHEDVNNSEDEKETNNGLKDINSFESEEETNNDSEDEKQKYIIPKEIINLEDLYNFEDEEQKFIIHSEETINELKNVDSFNNEKQKYIVNYVETNNSTDNNEDAKEIILFKDNEVKIIKCKLSLNACGDNKYICLLEFQESLDNVEMEPFLCILEPDSLENIKKKITEYFEKKNYSIIPESLNEIIKHEL